VAEQFRTIDEYIAATSEDVQAILEEIRKRIRAAVPDPGEKISYQMPTITMDGLSLVYFAAWKNHIGMYPIPRADEALEREIAPYRAVKDTVRFPYAKPIPYDLIQRLAALLVHRRLSGRD